MKQMLPLLLCLFLASCNKEESLIKQIESETNWKFEKIKADNADDLNIYNHTEPAEHEASKKTKRIKELIDKSFGALGEQVADGEFDAYSLSSRDEWKWESLKTEITYRCYFKRAIEGEDKYEYRMLIYYRDKK